MRAQQLAPEYEKTVAGLRATAICEQVEVRRKSKSRPRELRQQVDQVVEPVERAGFARRVAHLARLGVIKG